jgi:hypothetical protein
MLCKPLILSLTNRHLNVMLSFSVEEKVEEDALHSFFQSLTVLYLSNKITVPIP